MRWDDIYRSAGRLWGKEPSELGVAAARYLQEHKPGDRVLNMLDIGCGYGRDTFFLIDNVGGSILGIDTSPRAIDIASNAIPESWKEHVSFRCCSFTELKKGNYDAVYISNLYQVLEKNERDELRGAVMRALGPGGLMFFSTLSVTDPEHYGLGAPVPEDTNSFVDRAFLHFSTREELTDDFAFLNIKELYEHEYYEPHLADAVHHHISWILIGELPVEPGDAV